MKEIDPEIIKENEEIGEVSENDDTIDSRVIIAIGGGCFHRHIRISDGKTIAHVHPRLGGVYKPGMILAHEHDDLGPVAE